MGWSMDWVHGPGPWGGPWTRSIGWSMDPGPCFVYVQPLTILLCFTFLRFSIGSKSRTSSQSMKNRDLFDRVLPCQLYWLPSTIGSLRYFCLLRFIEALFVVVLDCDPEVNAYVTLLYKELLETFNDLFVLLKCSLVSFWLRDYKYPFLASRTKSCLV